MGTLFFVVGVIAGIAISLYGWFKIIATVINKNREKKDILVSIGWVIVYTVAAIAFWFLSISFCAGYLAGLVLTAAVCANISKPQEEKSEEGQ
jgi:O-antigen/teichoic acid export membrane protein